MKGSISDLWAERTTPCKTPSSRSQAEPTPSQTDSASCEAQGPRTTPGRTVSTPILKAGPSLPRKTQSESNLRSAARRGKGKHVEVVVPEVCPEDGWDRGEGRPELEYILGLGVPPLDPPSPPSPNLGKK